MGKGKKKLPLWLGMVRGVGLSLGVYAASLAGLSYLVVRGTVGEEAVLPIVAALAGAASFAGGLVTAGRCAVGPLPGGLLCAAVVGALLSAVGAACWQGVSLSGENGAILGALLLGGLCAGLAAARGGKRKRRGPL